VVIADRLDSAKETVALDDVVVATKRKLDKMQHDLYERAQNKVNQLISASDRLSQFGPRLEHGEGAYVTGWCTAPTCEAVLKQYKGTIRCLLGSKNQTQCFYCEKPSVTDVLVARSY